MDRRTFLKTVPLAILAAKASSSLAQQAVPATNPAPRPDAASASQPASAPAYSGNLKPIDLQKPRKDGGKSVLAALWERKTIREISDRKLSGQALGELLWAAFGVNRESGPFGQIGRTAGSASNSQEIDLYVALSEGVYLYEAKPHRLMPVADGDLRAKTGRGRRGGAATAPVSIIFVADLAKFAKARLQEPGLKDPEVQKSYYNIDAGLIAQNVQLYAAAEGLAAWFHNCDKPGLTEALKLRPDQHVLYAQTVGYPATPASRPGGTV